MARLDVPGGSDGKASAYNAGDPDSIPGLGRSFGEGNGNPLQYLAWKIPWTEERGRLKSTGLQRVGHDWATSVHFRPDLGAELLDIHQSALCYIWYGTWYWGINGIGIGREWSENLSSLKGQQRHRDGDIAADLFIWSESVLTTGR